MKKKRKGFCVVVSEDDDLEKFKKTIPENITGLSITNMLDQTLIFFLETSVLSIKFVVGPDAIIVVDARHVFAISGHRRINYSFPKDSTLKIIRENNGK